MNYYLTGGQIAKQAQVNVETLRYYERRGLLPEPRRRQSGYRLYSPDIVRRIRCIKQVQELGFSLHEIKDLLSLTRDADTPAMLLRYKAEATLSTIDRKLSRLQKMKCALERFIDQCDGKTVSQGCPIIETLNDDGAL